MSTKLGSSTKPTSTQEWSGVNTNVQVAHALTLPAGGPWLIVSLGAWMAGKDANCTTKLVIWDSTRNTVLGESASFTATGLSFALGNSTKYEKSLVTPVQVNGGTTVYVGWSRNPSHSAQWGRYSSGSHYDDSLSGSWPVGMTGETLDNGGDISAYLYYDPANSAPNAPTLVKIDAAASGSIVNGADNNYGLTFTGSDPDVGDVLASYDYQIDTTTGNGVEPDWASLTANVVGATAGISGQNVSTTIVHTLSRAQWYAMRVRTTDDDSATGAWSSTYYFKIASLPTTSLTEPSAAGRLGKLSFTAGSGWASPRLNAAWSFNCPDGGTQTHYEVDVANDSAGSPGTSLYASGSVASSAGSLVVPATLTEGNYYHVRVRVTCTHGEVSTYSGYFRVRTRWGFTHHQRDLTTAPLSWSISTLNTTTGSSNSVVVEYNSSTDGSTLPDAWKSDLSQVTLRRHMHYRVWFMAWGASPATSPSLNQIVLSYSAAVLAPDKWTRQDTNNAYATDAAFVYGTQSLQMDGKAAAHNVYQQVVVTPNTDYILSGRIKSSGASGAQIMISTAGTSGILAGAPAAPGLQATTDWARYSTAVWNSGANSAVYIRAYVDGAVGTNAWFDAIKMEASVVVTPWTPGFVGSAVVLDSGGLQIDAAAGGIFRLRGSGGATRDRVDLGANGLVFGGDANLYSPSANLLKTDDSLSVVGDIYGPGTDLRLRPYDTNGALGVVDAAASVAKNLRARGIYLGPNYGHPAPAQAGIQFDADVNLYRSAANVLKTDDALVVVGALTSASLSTGNLTASLAETTSTSFSINGGGSATYGSKSLAWYQLGKVVFFRLIFSVTANGSGTTTVTVTNLGLPNISGTARIAGDRGSVGVAPITGRLQPGASNAEITAIYPISDSVSYTDSSVITGADLSSGAVYSFHGMYITP